MPEVGRIETLRFGVVPVQALQKRFRSTLVKLPVAADVNVCPAQLVLVKPKPLLVVDAFCWSTFAGARRVTSPGLVVRSTFVNTPV